MNPMLHVYYINLRNGTVHQKIAKPLSGGSIDADQFEIHLQDCGRIVDLSSATVIGAVYRPDNSVVPLTAVAKDDAVLITLDKYCYAIPGMITLKVKIADEGILRTALSISMTVDEPDSAVIINNETLGTLSELVEAINSMDTAASEAQQVVDRAREDLLTTTEEANASMQATKDAANASMQATETAANASMQETKDAATATMEETASTANQSMAEVADTAVSSIKAAEDNAKDVLDEAADKLEGYVTRTEAAEADAKAARDQAADFALQANLSANTANNAMGSVQLMTSIVKQSKAEAKKSADASAASAAESASSMTAAQTAEARAQQNAQYAQTAADRAEEVHASIPDGYEDLADFAEKIAIRNSFDGSLASVDDAAAVYAVSVESTIEPALTGVGAPSYNNVRPVHGYEAISLTRTGRNLLRYVPADVSAVTYVSSTGETITKYGYDVHLPAGSYTATGAYKTAGGSGVYVYGLIIDATGKIVSGKVSVNPIVSGKENTVDFVLDEGEHLLLYNGAGSATSNTTKEKFDLVNLAIFVQGSDTTYEEPSAATLTTELPEVVYGGVYNWTTGILTVTHKRVTLKGTEMWTQTSGYPIYKSTAYLSDAKANSGIINSVCSHFNTTKYVSSATMADATMYLMPNPEMRFRHNGIDSVTAWKAWLADQVTAGTPVELVLKLKEPYELTIAPQRLLLLYKNNYVWSDCGNTAVSYVVDTKTYVDEHAVGGDGASVASVNGKTGAVELNAADVGAMPADAQIVDDDARKQIAKLSEEIVENDLPTVYYGGKLPQIKTEQIMPLRIVSKTMDVKGYCETKAQGNSSMNFPKKNQTTKLYADVACEEKLKLAFRNWGKQQKFCLKANWNDLSHARNVVSARIWGDMVRTRPDFDSIPELMRTSPNFGAIDGFPVRVFAAGEYQGRYAFNIPKDKWMANMDDENPNHCILCGEDYGSGCFRAPALIDGSDWTDEIHDTVPESIKTRWNQCIAFVQNSTDAEFKANLHQYFNVQSLIDCHIFGLASCNLDGFGKNQLFLTYDGLVWYASIYDMDATWGNHYMGTKLVNADYPRTSYEDYVSSASSGNGNLLYVRLEALFADEIKERWNSVKTTALSLDSILNRFEQWASICPPWIVAEDYAETTAEGAFVDMPGQDYNNIQQIRAFAKARHAWTETYINGEPTVNLWNIGERTYKLLPFSATKDKVPNYDVGLDEFVLSGSRTGYMTGNRQVEHTIKGNDITFKSIESGVGLFMPVALTPGKTYRLRFTTSDATGTMAVTWYDDTIKYVANTGALTPNNGLSYEGTFVAANYPNFAITAVAAGTTIPETITFSDVSLVELL